MVSDCEGEAGITMKSTPPIGKYLDDTALELVSTEDDHPRNPGGFSVLHLLQQLRVRLLHLFGLPNTTLCETACDGTGPAPPPSTLHIAHCTIRTTQLLINRYHARRGDTAYLYTASPQF
jgi:hypothetical protein